MLVAVSTVSIADIDRENLTQWPAVHSGLRHGRRNDPEDEIRGWMPNAWFSASQARRRHHGA
jgi:hypothetical protein